MKFSLERMLLAILLLAIIGVGSLFIIAGGAWSFLHKAIIRTEPTPAISIELAQDLEDLPYCPGEWIDFAVTIDPLRLPFVGHVVTTLWDRDHSRTAIAQGRDQELDTIYLSGETIHNPGRFYVPHTDRFGAPILPGRYEVRMGIVAEGASPAVVALPFTIPTTCVSKEQKGN